MKALDCPFSEFFSNNTYLTSEEKRVLLRFPVVLERVNAFDSSCPSYRNSFVSLHFCFFHRVFRIMSSYSDVDFSLFFIDCFPLQIWSPATVIWSNSHGTHTNCLQMLERFFCSFWREYLRFIEWPCGCSGCDGNRFPDGCLSCHRQAVIHRHLSVCEHLIPHMECDICL